MSTATNCLIKVFHLFAAAQYAFAIWYDWVHVLPEEIVLRQYSFGGKLVFLTCINVVGLPLKYFWF